MASKSLVNTIILLSRRSYAVVAENVREPQQPAAVAGMRKMVTGDLKGGSVEEEFWMRDPKTGNWIPESQFNQIDVVDLREKFLSKKNNQ